MFRLGYIESHRRAQKYSFGIEFTRQRFKIRRKNKKKTLFISEISLTPVFIRSRSLASACQANLSNKFSITSHPTGKMNRSIHTHRR